MPELSVEVRQKILRETKRFGEYVDKQEELNEEQKKELIVEFLKTYTNAIVK